MRTILRILFALLLLASQTHAADPCAIAGQCAPPLPAITEEPVDLSRVLLFREQHRGGRYEREQHEQVIVGTGVLRFSIHDIAGGGKLVPLPAGSYALLVDDVERGRIDVAGGTVAQFTMLEAEHKPGWRRVRVQEPSGALSPTWFVHVGTAVADRVVPVATSVYDWTHGAKDPTHRWAWVPADAKPARYPVAIRDWPHFATALAGKDLHLSALMPDTGSRMVDQVAPYSTFGKQSYYYSDMVHREPALPLLDGPPGTGTMPMPTHIEMGRATQLADPSSRQVRAVYVLNPWSLSRVNEDGTKRTLVGYRGWPGAMELVGDWRMPPERRGLHEAWSFRFDPASLVLDLQAPLINGRPPHLAGPVGYLADTQNNRILRVEFDPKSHDTPAIVTEHITGINDPFGLVIWRDELIVSERLAQRIAAYDRATGAFKRTVLTCDGTHYRMGLDREPVRLVPATAEAEALAKRRAAPCVAPEGLDLDGDELVFGSVSQAQIRRLNLITGALRVQGNVPVDAGSNFVVVAANDGTFGPPGTVFAATWSGTQFGYPIAIKADGSRWTYMQNTSTAPSAGRGPLWASMSYSAAVGVRGGRLVFGSSEFGLHQIGRAAANDPVIDLTKYNAGRRELDHLLFGDGGHSPYGYVPPRSANADYYLQIHGHALP